MLQQPKPDERRTYMARHPGRERRASAPESGAASKVAAALLAACAIALLPLFLRGDAGATGGWSSVASMSQSRAAHTATTLDDGRVLVAGGYAPPIPPSDSVTPLTSTEIYNPVTNTWSAAAPIAHARYDASAIKLNDGRVLLLGGGSVSETEIYDPITNAWTDVGAPAGVTTVSGATLMTDGNVFVVGTALEAFVYVPKVAIFHPGTNSWAGGPTFPTVGVPTILPDGSVLVTGGTFDNAALFVPPATVDSTPEMGQGKFYTTTTVLPDSRVLIAGYTGPSYLYVPSTKTFEPVAGIPDSRFWHTANQLPSGLVLIAGGMSVAPCCNPLPTFDSTYTFDRNTGTFTLAGTMASPRRRHASATLLDGRILVAGGEASDFDLTAGVEIFDPAAAPTPVPTHTPTPTPGGPTATFTHTPTPGGPTATFTPTPGGATATFTPTGTPTSPPGLPDLTVGNVTVTLETGGSCAFTSTTLGTRFTVSNIGTGAAGAFWINSNGTLVSHPGLGAGTSVSIWVSGYAGFSANVTVDSTNVVAESNEGNNTYSGPVAVPTLPATCTPTATPDPNVTPTPTVTATRTSTPTVQPPTPTNTPATCQFDTDGDFNNDCVDNCPSVANTDQLNTDAAIIQQPGKLYNDITRAQSDGMGDACDSDDDNDGLSDDDEAARPPCAAATAATNSIVSDSDGDRVLDGAECALGTSPNDPLTRPQAPCNASVDADSDGVLDGRETCYYGTSTAAADSDGDGCSDAREIASINLDTNVNAIDLSQIAQAFGAYPPPPLIASAHLVNFDTDKSGGISAIDLAFVARNFGAC